MSRYVFDPEEHALGSKWFSEWHRSPEHEDDAAMIDLDCVGFCRGCKMPLYLVEATRGTRRKNADVTELMARLIGVPVFVAYSDKTGARPGEICWDERGVRHHGWLSADQVWAHLLSIRQAHRCHVAAASA